MKQTTYTTRVLEASEGCWLTQAADVPASKRAITKQVFLASGEEPSAWREITDAEAEEQRRMDDEQRQEGAADAQD